MSKPFPTQDIALSAYLYIKGHKILRTSKESNSNRISFVFEETEQLLSDIYDYTKNQPTPVQSYYRGLSHIWNLIKQKNNGDRQT